MQPTQPQYNQIPSQPQLSNRASQPAINNSNFPQQRYLTKPNQNMQLSQTRQSMSSITLMQSMQSMQSMSSSDSISQQTSQLILPAQTFPIFYNNITFMVDPISLAQSSRKFKELIQPFINSNQQISSMHLEILCHDFTNRNMNNFLRLCQNLSTDVQDSEMVEICQIAKLFKADQIYNTGLSFVQHKINPDFYVPDGKYDGSDGKTYLLIEGETNAVFHAGDLNELDFASQSSNTNNNNIINNNNTVQNNDQIQNINFNQDKNVTNNQKIPSSENDENKDNQILNDPYYFPNKDQNNQNKRCKSVIYQVRVEPHTFKCPVYYFVANGSVMFTAKIKDFDVYIGEGNSVHIKKNTGNHVAHIFQYDNDHNIIRLKDQQFRLQYVNSGKPGYLSIDVAFSFKDQQLRWTPMTPRFDKVTGHYYLNLSGEYHHNPIKSKKNIALQNAKGNPTFILRKMSSHVYEIECLPIVDPLIIFTIGLSDIIGPSPYLF